MRNRNKKEIGRILEGYSMEDDKNNTLSLSLSLSLSLCRALRVKCYLAQFIFINLLYPYWIALYFDFHFFQFAQFTSEGNCFPRFTSQRHRRVAQDFPKRTESERRNGDKTARSLVTALIRFLRNYFEPAGPMICRGFY